MNSCACGCGAMVSRRFVSGHNLKGLKRTDEHRRKIGESQRRVWQTTRQRLAVGTRRVNRDGYVVVKVTAGKGPWALEHSLVAAEVLGRSLHRGELVHHINGNRQDNRQDNLFICRDRAHHNEVHRSQDRALRELLEAGFVRFRDGRYEAVLPRR